MAATWAKSNIFRPKTCTKWWVTFVITNPFKQWDIFKQFILSVHFSLVFLVHFSFSYISVIDVSFSLLLRENAAPIVCISLFFGRDRRWQQRQQRIKAATTKIKTPRKMTMIEIEDMSLPWSQQTCYLVIDVSASLHFKEHKSHCTSKLTS